MTGVAMINLANAKYAVADVNQILTSLTCASGYIPIIQGSQT